MPRRRLLILERDRFTCQMCGDMLPEEKLTVDHIRSIARGGSRNELYNLWTLCIPCHIEKTNENDLIPPNRLIPGLQGCQHPKGIAVPERAVVDGVVVHFRRCKRCGKALRPIPPPGSPPVVTIGDVAAWKGHENQAQWRVLVQFLSRNREGVPSNLIV